MLSSGFFEDTLYIASTNFAFALTKMCVLIHREWRKNKNNMYKEVCEANYGTDLNRFSECISYKIIKGYIQGILDIYGATAESL